MGDFHLMLLGSRAAGGFGLVFPEQIAITPDGRTCTSCAGIWDDSQIEGLARVTVADQGHGALFPPFSLAIPGARAARRSRGRARSSCRPIIPMAGRCGALGHSLWRALHVSRSMP
jgi:2,4-dienoyl-CoA reductase-like NADH-dependent reductase (Old Yellow Enzyme family)